MSSWFELLVEIKNKSCHNLLTVCCCRTRTTSGQWYSGGWGNYGFITWWLWFFVSLFTIILVISYIKRIKTNGISILTNVKDFFQLKTLIDRTQRERNKEQAKQMNKNCKSTEINYIKRASMTIPHDWETNQMSVLILRLQCIRVLWNRNVKYFCISRKERIEKISIKEHEWFFVYSLHRIAIA